MTAILLLSFLKAGGQADTLKIKSLVDLNERKVVIENLKIDVSFKIDDENKKINVIEKTKYVLTPQLPNISAKLFEYYDDDSKITGDHSIHFYTKSCGNYQPDGIFHSDLKVCQFYFEFNHAFENIEFYVYKKHYDCRFYGITPLLEEYPIKRATLTYEIPDGIEVDIIERNASYWGMKKIKAYDPDDKITKIKFEADTLPTYQKGEPYLPSPSYYSPAVLIVPKGYSTKNEKVDFFRDYQDLYNWYLEMVSKSSSDTDYVRVKAKKLVNNGMTDIEKIKTIYYWVQDSIRYIAFEEGLAGYVPEAADAVLKQKFGDCKGMANLLKIMLQSLGYDARLTWIGTKSIPFNYCVPSVNMANHVICTVFLNGQKYILDATDNYCKFGNYPHTIAGRKNIIENGKSYILDSIPEQTAEMNSTRQEFTYSIDKDMLVGKLNISVLGDSKTELAYLLADLASADHKTTLSKILSYNQPNITVKNLVYSHKTPKDSAFIINSDFITKGNISTFDNEMYVTPNSYENFEKLIADEKRIVPFDLKYNHEKQSVVTIMVPAGYKLKKLPPDFNLENEFITAKITYSLKNNQISCVKKISFKKTYIDTFKLKDWNNNIKKIKKAYAQQIVLETTT